MKLPSVTLRVLLGLLLGLLLATVAQEARAAMPGCACAMEHSAGASCCCEGPSFVPGLPGPTCSAACAMPSASVHAVAPAPADMASPVAVALPAAASPPPLLLLSKPAPPVQQRARAPPSRPTWLLHRSLLM